MKKYTRITCYGRGRWSAYLIIGCQSFCIVEDTSKKRAEWFRKNLEIALKHLEEEIIQAGTP